MGRAEQYLTVHEAADLMNVSARTIYRLISDGTIVPLHVRRAYRIDREQLVAALAAGDERQATQR